MNKRVYIVHRWDGSPDSDWLPWAKSDLEGKGYVVHIPTMPHPEHPKIEEWVPYLAGQVKQPDTETFFIGYSVGCQTVLRYLEQLESGIKVGGAVFVAGWFRLVNLSGPEEEAIAEPWLTAPIDDARVKQHTTNFAALFSSDDPWVPPDSQQEFERRLGAKTIVLSNRSHFEGSKKLPEAVSLLQGL